MDKSDLVAWAETLSAASPRLPGDEIVRRVNALAKIIRDADLDSFHARYSALRNEDRRIAQARRRERERCAKVCEEFSESGVEPRCDWLDCAVAIRALPDE